MPLFLIKVIFLKNTPIERESLEHLYLTHPFFIKVAFLKILTLKGESHVFMAVTCRHMLLNGVSHRPTFHLPVSEKGGFSSHIPVEGDSLTELSFIHLFPKRVIFR